MNLSKEERNRLGVRIALRRAMRAVRNEGKDLSRIPYAKGWYCHRGRWRFDPSSCD